MKNTILFIEGSDGFIPKAIIKKLNEARFKLICIPDNIDDIKNNRDRAEMILYYLSENNECVTKTVAYLIDLCKTDHKSVCLAGEPFNMAKAKKVSGSEIIYATYQRPINIDGLVMKMESLASSYTEFKREKNILIIDDDSDYIKVLHHWLKSAYRVDAVRSGAEALKFLDRVHPDLILLDFEMPGLDGQHILDGVRKNPKTSSVPIIFLTGKNDRDSVLRLLKCKPDGYLLKSMRKDDLLDSLNRFFANNILTQR